MDSIMDLNGFLVIHIIDSYHISIYHVNHPCSLNRRCVSLNRSLDRCDGDSRYTSGPDSALLFDDFVVSCCGHSCEVVDVPGVVYSYVSDIHIIIPYVAVLPRAVDLAELSDFVRFSSVASCRAMSEPEIKQKRKSGYYPIGARTRANGYKGKTGWPSMTKAQQQDDPVLRAFVRILFSTGWLSGCTLHVVSDEHIFYAV